jgi:hypothetical protein
LAHAKERAFYRVQYPLRERPTFSMEGVDLPVVDVSELGIRLSADCAWEVEEGDVLEGTIRFRDRGERRVEGEVVWKRGTILALCLRVPIPFGVILREQRYLRKRYRLVD